MGDRRQEAINAAMKAWWGMDYEVKMREIVVAVLDAVEPIIRADERERMADLARKVQGGGIRDYEAEVRERIAQDIERTKPKMKADPYLLISIEHAARIARRGGSDG